MNLYKKLSLIACVILLLVVLNRILFNNFNESKENTLTIGIMSGYPPFAQLDGSGQLEGLDIEVANLLAQKLNKKLIIKDFDLAGLIIALQQSKIDLILSGLCMTPERKKKMAMIQYGGIPRTAYPLIFWGSIPAQVKEIQDIPKLTNSVICVEAGSSQESFLAKFDNLNLRTMNSLIDMVMDLKYGKSIAALIDPDLLSYCMKKFPEVKVLDVPLPQELQSEGYGIAVNYKNQKLIEDIAKVVDELKQSGQLEALEKKWFGADYE